MSSKKDTVKRLIIYFVISFAPFWIIVPVMNAHFGEYIYVSEKAEVAAAAYVLGVFGMFTPTIANILTRIITKEGLKKSYLAPNFEGNLRYYFASVLMPVSYAAVNWLLGFVFILKGFGAGDLLGGEDADIGIPLLLLNTVVSAIVFFPAFGEEFGWRGYMMPKLLELMPKPAAIIAGGVIWGLWHAPLTVSGHNFGVDYKGYPYLGILIMCLFCVCMNAILTFLTEKSGTVYPASFCHMVNNNSAGSIFYALFGSKELYEAAREVPKMSWFTVLLPVVFVFGAVCFALFMKKDTKSKT